MTTNLAEARSPSRRDRRPSRNRERTVTEADPRSRVRANRAQTGEDPDADQQSRLESRRARYTGQLNQETSDRTRPLTTRRHSRGRSKSSSASTDDGGRDQPHSSYRARKSLDLSERHPVASRYGTRGEERQNRGEDSSRPNDYPSARRTSHNGVATASLSRSGLDGYIKDRSANSSTVTTEASRANGNHSQNELRLSHRRVEEQPELERSQAKEASRSRRELRERLKTGDQAPKPSSSIQSSQCLIEGETETDPLKEIATTVLQNKQDQAKKLAEQEQAKKVAERAALRERRRLERERMEREREAAEAAAAAERAIITQKAAAAAEKRNCARQTECVDDAGRSSPPLTPTELSRPATVPGDRQSTEPSSGERRESAAGKPRSATRKKTVDNVQEDDGVKPNQTPRRTLVVRDSNIPTDTQEEDRVILVSGIDDEGARAKKPSDYKREASTGLIRKRSITTQPPVEFSSPRQSTGRSVKLEKSATSPFRPCPGFAGVEGSNELMKALAFRRQKTMGTEKEYHATGNNSSLAIDDRVVKTGSRCGDDEDDDESDEDSYSVG